LKKNFVQLQSKNCIKIVQLAHQLNLDPNDHLPEGLHIGSGDKTMAGSIQSSLNALQKRVDKQIDIKQAISSSSKFSIAYWVTISPPTKYDNISNCLKIMEYLTDTSLFKDTSYMYVYEWRDHENETGCHIHILIHRLMNDVDPCNQLRPFKKLTPWGINPKNQSVAVKIKYAKNDTGIGILEKYLSGEKVDQKMNKVKYDRELRELFGLKHLYVKDAQEKDIE